MRIRKKGFTLIEVVVVVIIIAILTTISFAVYTKAIERARDEDAKTALRLIYAAQKIHFMKYGQYFPVGGGAPSQNVNDINTSLNLKIDGTYWDYRVWGGDMLLAWALRKNPPLGFDRVWQCDNTGIVTCNSGNCNY